MMTVMMMMVVVMVMVIPQWPPSPPNGGYTPSCCVGRRGRGPPRPHTAGSEDQLPLFCIEASFHHLNLSTTGGVPQSLHGELKRHCIGRNAYMYGAETHERSTSRGNERSLFCSVYAFLV
jgi:hypothetical protein